MKLIDLLVKELPKIGGWPSRLSLATYPSKSIRELGLKHEVTILSDSITHSQGGDTVTRAQYEAALADSEGWIEWGGGECPVETGVLVDIRIGHGCELYGVKAAPKAEYSHTVDMFWEHKGAPDFNIIAYRLHKPDINSRANDDRLEQDLNECIGQDVDMPEWNSEGLPPVGCECEAIHRSCDSWQPIKVIAVNDGAVFGFWVSGNTPCALPVEVYQFRPLRTEAEKAREAAIHDLTSVICGNMPDTGMATAAMYAERVYDAGYRKENK